MGRPRRLALLLLAGLVTVAVGPAHVRLMNPADGVLLRWERPDDVGVVFSSAGSDDLPDGGHLAALRGAIAAWNGAEGSLARFVEDTTPAQQARSDWPADDLRCLFFDEDGSSGFFPAGSATVAITAIEFDLPSGHITDADVLFNGSGFRFSTDPGAAEVGVFDLQDIATHELGHVLGLDHSGWGGSSLYPYVSEEVILHRSLSRDEVGGLRAIYPAQAFGVITGSVLRVGGGEVVSGAHVTASDWQGRTVAGALTDASGCFFLEGLEGGSYTISANPLDFPVGSLDLLPGRLIETDFQATFSPPVWVQQGESAAYGPLYVTTDGSLSLGDRSDAYPLRAVLGTTQVMTVGGAGLLPGSTLLASDPSLAIDVLSWFDTGVSFRLGTPAGAAPGHVDLLATGPLGELDILPGVIEITPPDPVVARISPAVGDVTGGISVAVTGAGFRPGAQVSIGPEIYRDGEPGGCAVVDAGLILLATAATATGHYDVIVQDPTGVEGRLADGFHFAPTPRVGSVFPRAGAAFGGTRLIVRGEGFQEGASVRIGGVPQSEVRFDGPQRLTVIASGGALGTVALEVVNPGGTLALGSFTYVPLPDPRLTAVSPSRGKTGGGDLVTLAGSGFSARTEVWFGVDPETGEGGVSATEVILLGPGRLSVTTPAHAAGAVAVMVRDPLTGQALASPEAFTFAAPGGGGGCHSLGPAGGLPPLAELAAGTWWLLATALFLGLRARRARPRAAIAA